MLVQCAWDDVTRSKKRMQEGWRGQATRQRVSRQNRKEGRHAHVVGDVSKASKETNQPTKLNARAKSKTGKNKICMAVAGRGWFGMITFLVLLLLLLLLLQRKGGGKKKQEEEKKKRKEGEEGEEQ